MITPTEAKKISDPDAAELASWETKIDEKLKSFYDKKILVDIGGLESRVRDKLIKMYRDSGWTVGIRHGDEQNPGIFLVFCDS